jgi:hypothetical protein
MEDVLQRDFFTDPGLLQDPAPWYTALREQGPVWREPHRGVVVLSGIEEILAIYADHERFSAIVGTLGPLIQVPRPDPGESWAEVIERRRSEIPMGEMLPSIDPPRHTGSVPSRARSSRPTGCGRTRSSWEPSPKR